jgi:hypothetical protein
MRMALTLGLRVTRRSSKFGDAFFSKFDQFQKTPRHPTGTARRFRRPGFDHARAVAVNLS